MSKVEGSVSSRESGVGVRRPEICLSSGQLPFPEHSVFMQRRASK